MAVGPSEVHRALFELSPFRSIGVAFAFAVILVSLRLRKEIKRFSVLLVGYWCSIGEFKILRWSLASEWLPHLQGTILVVAVDANLLVMVVLNFPAWGGALRTDEWFGRLATSVC